jgi:hypothetical protein
MRKLLLGLAGIGVAATAIGGGTFATYSDYAKIEDNTSGAGILRLDMDDPATLKFDNIRLSPHDGDEGPYDYYERVVFLTSSDSKSAPNGDLSLTFSDFDDIEGDSDAAGPFDAVSNCTTQSEMDAEGGACGTDGEFAEQAQFRVAYSDPVTASTINPDLSNCSFTHYSYLTSARKALDSSGLPGFTPDPYPTVNLASAMAPGKGVCVRFEVSLGSDATNASQGDSISWDTQIDLNQTITH